MLLFPIALISLPLSVALLNGGCAPTTAHLAPGETPGAAGGTPALPAGQFVALVNPPLEGEFDPAALLSDGKALQEAGEYQQAKDRYRSILFRTPNGPQAPEARFQLAVVAYTLADYKAAADGFVQFRQRHPTMSQANIALFWLAESQRNAGDNTAALGSYEQFALLSPQVAEIVRQKRAQVLLTMRDGAGAARELEAAASASPMGWTDDLRRRYAEAQMLMGRTTEAIQTYRELYRSATTEWAKAELLYLIAQGQRAAGDGGAASTLTDVVRSYPSSFYAKLALGGGVPGLTPYEEGRVLYYQRDNAGALEAFQRQWRTQPGSPQTPWSRYRTALVYERQDKNREALAELDNLLRDYQSGEIAEETLYERAVLLDYLGEDRAASDGYADFVSRFPASRYVQDARFKQGLAQYRRGDYVSAARTWSMGESDARSRLWQGKALAAAGDRGGAVRALQQAQEPRPGRYYAQRANDLLTGADQRAAANYRPLSGAITSRVDTEATSWIATWSSNDSQYRPDQDPAIQRAALLHEMGLQGDAAEQYRAVIRTNKDDPQALYAIARMLYGLKQYGPAVMAATLVWEAAPVRSPEALPDALLRILYPVPYSPQVLQSAREWGVDPLFLYAVMRQESMFNPWATSSASAKGLTQVTPPTGQGIARALGVDGFTSDDLYRPALSIRFGAYYLAQQLKSLGGEPAIAAAAYNAGGGSARRWLADAPRIDRDLFVETIDYDETAAYVRIVMENYSYYTRLYGFR